MPISLILCLFCLALQPRCWAFYPEGKIMVGCLQCSEGPRSQILRGLEVFTWPLSVDQLSVVISSCFMIFPSENSLSSLASPSSTWPYTSTPQASVSSADSTTGRASTAESIPRFGTTDLTDVTVSSGCLGENPGISPWFTLEIPTLAQSVSLYKPCKLFDHVSHITCGSINKIETSTWYPVVLGFVIHNITVHC